MPTIKAVSQGRSVDGGHAVEIDFVLNDNSAHTLKIPYENIPHTMQAISASAQSPKRRKKRVLLDSRNLQRFFLIERRMFALVVRLTARLLLNLRAR